MRNRVVNYIVRYLVFIAGIFIMSLGIALSTRAGLGTSPISCLPYAISMISPWSIGVVTIVMNVGFTLIQLVLLRRDFEPVQFLQFPVAFLFGWFVDISMNLTSGVAPTTYPMRWVFCLLATLVLAFGIFTEVKAGVVMLCGEGLVATLARLMRKPFSTMKVIFDVTLVCIGAAITFFSLGNLAATREGTIAMALLTGTILRFFYKHIYWYDGLTEKIELEEDLDLAAADAGTGEDDLS